MEQVFHIFTLVLVAIAMALSLAHALELPGKMRLPKEIYLEVQQIYYPGFTYGGLCEIGGIIALAILATNVPWGGERFWWVAASLALLLVCHSIYWLVTHPVNGFWVKDVKLSGLGARFFPTSRGREKDDWTKLRDMWEFSHVARATFAMASFIAAAVALSLT